MSTESVPCTSIFTHIPTSNHGRQFGYKSTARIKRKEIRNFSFFSSFVAAAVDILPIENLTGFLSAFREESGKLWYLVGPAIFTSLCQYSLGAFTQTFAGHVGTLELAAFLIKNSVIAGLSLDLGMGSTVETLCGHAFSAGQLDMLGVYLQRSWVILFVTGLLLMFRHYELPEEDEDCNPI